MAERNTYYTINENSNAIVSSKTEVIKMFEELGVRKGMTILLQGDMNRL